MSSVKKLAIRGAIWTFVGYGLSQGLRLVGNIILANLLVPELFGLMGFINTFLIGLSMFSDVGIGTSIIQNKRGDDPRFLNTAWTIQVIRGVGLWLCCWILALPAVYFYNDERLLWLIPTAGLCAIVEGFNSTALFVLNRHIAIGKLTILELTVQILGTIAMIVWAMVNPSIWALLIGNFTISISKMLLSHLLIRDKPNRFDWDSEAFKELVSFGKWIFISTLMAFLAVQSDRVILPKLASWAVFGVYNVAYAFAALPQAIIKQLSNKIILALVSQFSDIPRDRLREKILDKRKMLLAPIGGLLVLLVCFGDLLVSNLYNANYRDAAWMLPILALGVWPHLLFETSRQSLVAIGKPVYQAYGQFAKSLHVCLGLPLSYFLFGLPGFIVMVAFNDMELYAINLYGLWREKLGCFRQDLKATLLLLLVLAIVLSVRYFLGFGLPLGEEFAAFLT